MEDRLTKNLQPALPPSIPSLPVRAWQTQRCCINSSLMERPQALGQGKAQPIEFCPGQIWHWTPISHKPHPPLVIHFLFANSWRALWRLQCRQPFLGVSQVLSTARWCISLVWDRACDPPGNHHAMSHMQGAAIHR